MEILILAGLILLNGLFSMAEIALVSARKSRLEGQANKGDKKAGEALKLANDALAMPSLAGATPPGATPQASAERANAFRVQAQALSALGQHDAAVTAAGVALDLDQSLGLAQRVLLDLQLLANAHRSRGDTGMAHRYQGLADRAQAAGQALRGDVQAD